MPKATTTQASDKLPVRESPRKRKRTETNGEEQANPSTDQKKSPNTRNKPTKQDIVVDEPARTKIANKVAKGEKVQETEIVTPKKPSTKKRKIPKVEEETDSEVEVSKVKQKTADANGSSEKKPRQRKTQEEKNAESMPLAARTAGLNMYVGAHVSIAKGVENAITNALHIGGNAFALFLQSQRKWENPDLKNENRDAFKSACSEHKYDALSHVVPHGSYLVNLAAKDEEQAKKSYNFFLNDLKRCEALGIRYYNFHPGATGKEPLNEAIARLAKHLNQALSETKTVTPLLENMAGTESIIGSRFSDLSGVISQIKPEYQSRIGICIDTCHAFAAGYDLRTPEAFKKTFEELDKEVGLKYLKAMHLNDSKGIFKSKKDLHQNIGLGFLGLRAFHNVMNEPRLKNVPLILETPCEKEDPKNPKKTLDDKTVWAKEIKLLESLIGMDPNGTEFKKLEAELSEKGRVEREKMEKWQVDKDAKTQRKLEKTEKGQKSIGGMFGGKGGNKKDKKKSEGSESGSGLSDEN